MKSMKIYLHYIMNFLYFLLNHLSLIALNLKNNLYFFNLNNLVNYFLLIILLIYYFNNFSLINDKYKSFYCFLFQLFFYFYIIITSSTFHFTFNKNASAFIYFDLRFKRCINFEILFNIQKYNHQNKLVIKYVFYSILIISLFLSVIYNSYNLKNLIKSNQENLNLSLNKEEIISSLNNIGSNKIYILNKDVDDSYLIQFFIIFLSRFIQ